MVGLSKLYCMLEFCILLYTCTYSGFSKDATSCFDSKPLNREREKEREGEAKTNAEGGFVTSFPTNWLVSVGSEAFRSD